MTNIAAALTTLIETRTLTDELADNLGLQQGAVVTYNKLPPETQQGMLDVLIDRFSAELGGSWVN